MTSPEPDKKPANQPPNADERAVPSEGPLKNEPTPERAQQQKERSQSWEQKKSGAV